MDIQVRLYEYAIVLQPKTDKDGEITEPAEIVVPPTTVLATSDEQAQIKAARSIPDTVENKLDRLSIIIRPF